MVKPRIPETNHGTTGEPTTQTYDVMMRRLMGRGWMETGDIIKAGISSGMALELGPGPGCLGLEWLKNTEGTSLKGLDVSDDMIAIARRNAVEYSLAERAEYVKGDATTIPFEPGYFDAVFSNGSQHEWARPKEIQTKCTAFSSPEGTSMSATSDAT
jgi:ubiquinone/menaquinone biosynthesis C-methylase UbiE